MIIGVPKEIKNNENRVALDPIAVGVLTAAGHDVYVEAGAGLNSSFTDEAYLEAGATIFDSAEGAWNVDMVMKVKEPQESEFQYFREGLILFTYLHLANEEKLTKALVESKVSGVAYETIESPDGRLPLLEPMSEVAGRLATQNGIHYLEKINGGKGIVLGGIPGTSRGTVSIIGGGTVGANAAKIAVGLGANVIILELDPERRRELEIQFGDRVQTLASNSVTIAESVAKSDIVVGSVLVPGAKAPKLVTEEMMQAMEPGSVIVDPSIDQGGNFEGFDEPTTHSDPIIERHGILYYGVANMPGAAPKTASTALAGNTVGYALRIANSGSLEDAVKDDAYFIKGVNTYKGEVTYEAVANDLGYDYKVFTDLI